MTRAIEESNRRLLRARGVEFTQEQVEQSYEIDCGLRDPFGNAIRIVQPPG